MCIRPILSRIGVSAQGLPLRFVPPAEYLSAVSDDGQSEHTNSEDIYHFRIVCIGRKLTGDERRDAFMTAAMLPVGEHLSDMRWGVPS